MELEVGSLTGAAYGEKSPERLVQRNDYPVMYVKAVHDVVKAHRGDDFLVMPRAA